ncbi:MAG: DUF1015 domain-containing protein [Oscillospiraceae bacterium]|nr:DUF1015 domain-containing protein [Oscillospiraceae bacterium]
MAVVKPFRALRYDFEKAGAPETLCCPPYDVIPDASVWTGKSPYNAIFLEGGERLGTADPYGDAKRALDGWLADGILAEDGAPACYLYEAAFTARDGSAKTLRGLAALLELSPYSDGVVLPHEHTLPKDGEDRRRLMAETGCQFSPIYCLYDDPDGAVAGLIPDAPPDVSFTMPDGTAHSLRILSAPDVCQALTATFADKKIYIADGHHRYGTLLRLRAETGTPKYAMAFLTDIGSAGVDLWATHRAVLCADGVDEAALRRALENDYTLTEGDTPEDGTFVWLAASGAWTLTPKRPWTEKSSVAALHSGILEPLLGIGADALAGGKAIAYTRDAAEAKALVRDGRALCAFLLPPPKMSELRGTVLAGEKMPQKSTYFYPKIITGLFMRRF